MTPNISLLCLSRTAAVTLAANRFIEADGTYPNAGGPAFGVTRSSAEVGDQVPVDVLGTAAVEAGAAIAVNAVLKVDATGRVVTHDATNTKVGIALSSASAAGELVEVFLIPNA